MLDYDWKCKYNNRLSGTPSIGVEFAPRSGISKLHDNRRVRLEALVIWILNLK
jgi:hypothetical protein